MVPTFPDFDFSLRDGRIVHIRAMQTSDETALLEAFGRLSPEVRYLRFMRVVGNPNIERLREVLANNQPMLRLAARLGFRISSDSDDPTVRICHLRLTDFQDAEIINP